MMTLLLLLLLLLLMMMMMMMMTKQTKLHLFLNEIIFERLQISEVMTGEENGTVIT